MKSPSIKCRRPYISINTSSTKTACQAYVGDIWPTPPAKITALWPPFEPHFTIEKGKVEGRWVVYNQLSKYYN